MVHVILGMIQALLVAQVAGEDALFLPETFQVGNPLLRPPDDRPRTAVVDRKLTNLQTPLATLEHRVEPLHGFASSASEAIETLVFVAHRNDTGTCRRHFLEQKQLCPIEVLALVGENKVKPGDDNFQYVYIVKHVIVVKLGDRLTRIRSTDSDDSTSPVHHLDTAVSDLHLVVVH